MDLTAPATTANNFLGRAPIRKKNSYSTRRRKPSAANGARVSFAQVILALFALLAVLPLPADSESIWRKLRAGSHRSSATAAIATPAEVAAAEPTAAGGSNTTNNATDVSSTESDSRNNSEIDNDERRRNRKLFSRSRRNSRHRQQFLERVALTSELLQEAELEDTSGTKNATAAVDLEAVTPQSDLCRPGRHIHVVTTAALPWFTGTAVNPLLRAAYLHRRTQEINNNNASGKRNSSKEKKNKNKKQWVTLVIPWLELPEDQEILYGGRVFADMQEQEDYIRSWLRDEAGLADAADPSSGLEILFYPARYHAGLGSIFAMGDIMDTVLSSDGGDNDDDRQLDVCVLEEPEHCNWYRAPGDSWTKRFNYVVGIVHTSEFVCVCVSFFWCPLLTIINVVELTFSISEQ